MKATFLYKSNKLFDGSGADIAGSVLVTVEAPGDLPFTVGTYVTVLSREAFMLAVEVTAALVAN